MGREQCVTDVKEILKSRPVEESVSWVEQPAATIKIGSQNVSAPPRVLEPPVIDQNARV